MHLLEPRALRHLDLVDERKSQLASNHIAPLEQWAKELESRESRTTGVPTYIPHFDPGDAGINATILTVLEAPGPMTHANQRGSGFISVDNDDQTAENTWQLRKEANAIDGVLATNIVPWYLGAASRKPRIAELQRGVTALENLLKLLPNLHTVLLAGRYAQNGWNRFIPQNIDDQYRIINTWHPSPLALNSTVRRLEALDAWKLARS